MSKLDLPYYTHTEDCPVQTSGQVDDCTCGARAVLIRTWQLAVRCGRHSPCFACGATCSSGAEFAFHPCPASGRPGSPPLPTPDRER